MGYVIQSQRVRAYDEWKAAFDAHADLRKAHGAKGHLIYRGIDEPTRVVSITEFASHDKARAFLADPAAQAAMADGGLEDPVAILLSEPVDESRY
jgi:heme-degrading monooxygenase HmoA